ncbi:hypothetical protein FPZ43_18700 [Mucilaginibacter pallidiroseus]|uniref:Uncharacterized protein n=1 Tax=Mucilaginibacter pallidiroseus TaxID=2599295 RepID=A0A563TXE5_9SPHI|nr:hypothetical protein [Mucilaginibacter pallidiroseus]TWR24038.1 hypothetical protein FPZ43_18700 [Mucilaginibacter pallidiroseus]
MNTPNSKTPGQQPTGDPKVDAAEQEVITNSEESDKIVNEGGAVADTEGINETLSEDQPSTELSADSQITNDESDVITNSDASNDITPEV